MADPQVALRRLVAGLADRSAEDVEAVLAALTPDHEARARVLLGEYAQIVRPPSRPKTPAARPEPEPRLEPSLADLSPWLADRVAPSPGGVDPLTPRARAALVQAARAVLPLSPLAPPAQPRGSGPITWLRARWGGERRR